MFVFKKYFIIIVFVSLHVGTSNIYAQSKEDLSMLRQEVLVKIDENGEGYKKFIDYYAKEDSKNANILRVKALLKIGDYQKAVVEFYNLSNGISNSDDNNYQQSFFWIACQLTRNLGLGIVNKDFREKIEPKKYSKLITELSVSYDDFSFLKGTQKQVFFLESLNLFQKEKNAYLTAKTLYYLGYYYSDVKNYEKAADFFQKAKVLANANGFESVEFNSICSSGEMLLKKKDYSKAYDLLFSLLDKVKNSQDIDQKIRCYNALIMSSSKVNNLGMVNLANDSLMFLSNQKADNLTKARAIFASYNEINNQKELSESKKFWNIIIVLVSSMVVLAIVFVFWIKTKNKKIAEQPALEQELKPFSIPDKTEAKLLQKLVQYENSGKYTQKNVSLRSLSQAFETNPRYLSEIINKHKNINFNNYINELRIDYIIKKLENNPEYRKYKVSYLAEEAGFSSHSLFTTVFKNKVGKSPTEFIQDLK